MATHRKMPREERAKQFMPFAALTGYSRALREKEEEVLRSYEAEEGTKKGPENTQFCENNGCLRDRNMIE